MVATNFPSHVEPMPSYRLPAPDRHLKLTDRWTVLKHHAVQQMYFWHPARFKINPSGRRSGKTELLKRKAVLMLLMRRAWPVKLALAAPSEGQARDIFWDDMKALIPPAWVSYINETRLEIRTKWGAMLRVFGFDRPRRIEGVPWDWIGVDELADCPEKCFARHIRPALATLGRNGGCDLIGVPDEVGRNQAEYEAMYETGLGWPKSDPEICSFHWSSADIIDPSEVAAMARQMDPTEFEQELGGRFMRSGGKALPFFDRRVHVDERFAAYCPTLPIDWTLDFGVTPAASLLCQTYRSDIWVMDEMVVETDGSVPAQVDAFWRTVNLRRYDHYKIRVFGEPAGQNAHSNIGVSDWEIMEQYMAGHRVEWMQLTRPELIKDTLNAVRQFVCTADFQPHIFIHPRCTRLIEDLTTAPWPDPNKLRSFHCLAALRYYCFALRMGTGGITIGKLSMPAAGGAN